MNFIRRGLGFIALECQPPAICTIRCVCRAVTPCSQRRAADFAECIAGQGRVRIRKLRVLESVEGFQAQLNVHPFRNRGGLGQRQVKVGAAGAAEEIPRRGAVPSAGNVRHGHKRCAVEVEVSRLA